MKDLELSKEQKYFMISEIKTFFLYERDEEIGDLAADVFLDFVTKKIAKEFYNKGVEDAYNYYNERMLDVLAIQK